MTDPIHAAGQIQTLASKSSNERLAFVMAGISVALLTTMALKEFMALGREIKHDCFSDGRGRSR